MTKAVMPPKQTRRVFTAEFKQEAVRRMAERRAQGVSLQQIRRELDVSADMLRSSSHQLKPGDAVPLSDVFPGQGRLPSDQEELRRLQRENHRLQQENSSL
ncbi:MAG: transposase [Gemmatimonadaceae bacterium]|nr:transposase [Gemmatimonadaceae bacterium]